MTKPEIDPSNIIPISWEDLDDGQLREIEQHLKATQEALLAGCFIKTHQGVVRKPGSTPKVTVNEENQIRLPKGHVIPSPEELKHRAYSTGSIDHRGRPIEIY
uniref:Uncharacterized protein n=1 Tax=Oryza meridionalis TaxID=40149 RepID=A0A0E0C2C6_9ORYZ